MALLERIDNDYIQAYKAKNSVQVAVLRLLKTAIKNRLVELGRDATLSDDDVLDLVSRQVKQRLDSIEQYSKAGREELAENERQELAVLKEYMPAQLTDEELEGAIASIIAETGASGMQDMGKVMQQLTAQYKGRVDGKKASGLVRSRLAT